MKKLKKFKLNLKAYSKSYFDNEVLKIYMSNIGGVFL